MFIILHYSEVSTSGEEILFVLLITKCLRGLSGTGVGSVIQCILSLSGAPVQSIAIQSNTSCNNVSVRCLFILFLRPALVMMPLLNINEDFCVCLQPLQLSL